MPSRDSRAAFWAQAVSWALLKLMSAPTRPWRTASMSKPGPCDIRLSCPTFSSRVIRPRRASTRASTSSVSGRAMLGPDSARRPAMRRRSSPIWNVAARRFSCAGAAEVGRAFMGPDRRNLERLRQGGLAEATALLCQDDDPADKSAGACRMTTGRGGHTAHGLSGGPRRNHRRTAKRSGLNSPLTALPVRRALGQEGVHALAEILAHVAHQDQVVVRALRAASLDPAQGLLGGLQGQGRMAGDQAGELIGARSELFGVVDA